MSWLWCVVWPKIYVNESARLLIGWARQKCSTCAEHLNSSPKPPVHPWTVPEKPWTRVHVDHAVNFLGFNWLIVVDAYSKCPCIHQTTSTASRSTIDLLENDFTHFGYPLSIVTDNATSFTSEEFQDWCRDQGMLHLSGPPYHPATNWAAQSGWWERSRVPRRKPSHLYGKRWQLS
jgi:transposase InsO family protein